MPLYDHSALTRQSAGINLIMPGSWVRVPPLLSSQASQPVVVAGLLDARQARRPASRHHGRHRGRPTVQRPAPTRPLPTVPSRDCSARTGRRPWRPSRHGGARAGGRRVQGASLPAPCGRPHGGGHRGVGGGAGPARAAARGAHRWSPSGGAPGRVARPAAPAASEPRRKATPSLPPGRSGPASKLSCPAPVLPSSWRRSVSISARIAEISSPAP